LSAAEVGSLKRGHTFVAAISPFKTAERFYFRQIFNLIRIFKAGDIRCMIRRKRIEIIIEEQSALEITWHDSGASAWCQECGENARIVSLEKAAQILGVSSGEIDLLIHSKVIHCVVSTAGRLAICIKSMITGISSRVDDDSAREC
jgi:hypothetical protein